MGGGEVNVVVMVVGVEVVKVVLLHPIKDPLNNKPIQNIRDIRASNERSLTQNFNYASAFQSEMTIARSLPVITSVFTLFFRI
jgi:hypothetical protein